MSTTTHTSSEAAQVGNTVNLVLGIWLAISSFVWPHAGPALANSLIVGVLIAVMGAASLWRPALSAFTTLPALWLLMTTLFLRHGSAITPLHNAFIGAIVVIASTTPLVAYPDHVQRPAH